MGKYIGISFMDSTTLKVCRNQRIHNHKGFRGLTERGKSSMGWFYGFKPHLVCNEKGELLSFYLTKGNVDDRNPKHIKKNNGAAFGKLFAYKGYLSNTLWEFLNREYLKNKYKLNEQMLFADVIQFFTNFVRI